MTFSDWTLAELKGFRKELSRSLVSGSLTVRYADRSVQYRTMDEMERIMALLDGEIADREGRRRVRHIQVHSRKGFA